jgi:hypothetical protein
VTFKNARAELTGKVCRRHALPIARLLAYSISGDRSIDRARNSQSPPLTLTLFLALFFSGAAHAQAQQPRLTIYNQNFAVVRVVVSLDLKTGENRVQLSDITNQLEPDSVILRDPAGKFPLRILEQNYRADPVSQGRMLQLYEGKEIDFRVVENGHSQIVRATIIRSGYVPPPSELYPQQPRYAAQPQEPIIEVNGQIRFSLPGEPLFPALAQGTILKPVLTWVIGSEKSGRVNAELSYITEGLDWNATYNVIEPAAGKSLELVGWVTMRDRSGKTFDNAKIKLMAATVNKIQSQPGVVGGMVAGVGGGVGGEIMDYMHGPLVTQQPFDVYHLYTLQRLVTLHDQETKQVEFIRADGIASTTYYVYDGVKVDLNQYSGWNIDSIRQNSEFGTQSTPAVRVMREIQNTKANHLGIPLPAGRMRFYKADEDGNLEFLGESHIRHVPQDETVDVYTGNAFDLTGSRTRTNYEIDNGRRTLDESFKIQLHNHHKQTVEIRVDEHLYRGDTWEITPNSNAFVKLDSHMIEFRVQVPPDGEKDVTYTVHYTW